MELILSLLTYIVFHMVTVSFNSQILGAVQFTLFATLQVCSNYQKGEI